ncbi:MAG: nuclear transport factor 2 family protein [Cytophagales bacterium]|nr:nuclear transport factor 2 family protein [Cytophagales bacterium]
MNATQGELMERNLDQVMNQRDPAKRRAAMESIYADDATFYEVDAVATGYEAVNAIIQSVLEKMPPDFVFHPTKPATENHNVGRLSWGVGPAGGPAVVTGTDVVLFKDGRIQSLYVFLDKTGD